MFKESGLDEIEETKNEAPGELINDVTANDATESDEKESVEECDETEGVAPDELVERDLELKVELLRITANHDFGLLSDVNEQDDDAADVFPRRSL